MSLYARIAIEKLRAMVACGQKHKIVPGCIVKAVDVPFPGLSEVIGRYGIVLEVDYDKNNAIVDFGDDNPHILIGIEKLKYIGYCGHECIENSNKEKY